MNDLLKPKLMCLICFLQPPSPKFNDGKQPKFDVLFIFSLRRGLDSCAPAAATAAAFAAAAVSYEDDGDNDDLSDDNWDGSDSNRLLLRSRGCVVSYGGGRLRPQHRAMRSIRTGNRNCNSFF